MGPFVPFIGKSRTCYSFWKSSFSGSIKYFDSCILYTKVPSVGISTAEKKKPM